MKRTGFFLCLFITIGISPCSAGAPEIRTPRDLEPFAPDFSLRVEDSLFERVQDFILSNGDPALPARIAKVDLNADGVPELIICQTGVTGACTGKKGCPCHLLGDSRGGFTPIGQFSAFRIMIQPVRESLYREVHAYDNPDNHFHATRYLWSPAEGRYVPLHLKSRF